MNRQSQTAKLTKINERQINKQIDRQIDRQKGLINKGTEGNGQMDKKTDYRER